ncbi:MAG TPA: histidine phosphatase family protein [Rhizobiales bacterium]|nr:histidine phosphatase family protein [Hyphomicrobiales bacterium]
MRLLLMRHAKSGWGDPGLADHARPLTKRGRKAAAAMGRYMAAHGLVPKQILCSSAKRAKQTLKGVTGELKAPDDITITDDLYAFSGFQAPLNVIRRLAKNKSPLMVIAHNPSIEDLAFELTGAGNNAARALMAQKYPTAALAVIDFDLHNWAELQTGIGTMINFIRPRDL